LLFYAVNSSANIRAINLATHLLFHWIVSKQEAPH
jgi:hypothetical protein